MVFGVSPSTVSGKMPEGAVGLVLPPMVPHVARRACVPDIVATTHNQDCLWGNFSLDSYYPAGPMLQIIALTQFVFLALGSMGVTVLLKASGYPIGPWRIILSFHCS